MQKHSFSEIRKNINPFQHVLITGQTGAGKNLSALNPYLEFIVDNKNNFYSSAILAIDPKKELQKVIKESNRTFDTVSRAGIRDYTGANNNLKIDFFESFDYKVDLHESYSKKLIQFLNNFVDKTNSDQFWHDQADQFISAIFELELFVSGDNRLKGYNERCWLNFTNYVINRIDGLNKEQFLCEQVLERKSLLSQIKCLQNYLNLAKKKSNVFEIYRLFLYNPSLLNEYLNYLKKSYNNVDSTNGYQFLDYISQLHSSNTYGQYYGVVGASVNYLDVLISEELSEVINFHPFMNGCDKYSILDCLEQSKIVLFSPNHLHENDHKLGKILKSLFFEFSFLRRNKNLPFFYFCDEFQQYITTDQASGEANFLDRCRSFNVSCILATQSKSALHNSLLLKGIRVAEVEAAVDSILTNIGSKIFFRSTDTRTNNELKQIIPISPVTGQPHIIDVRPISTLKVGECYYALANGDWGRKQINLNART